MITPERFLSKTMYAGDCIVWTGATTKAGYGQVHISGTKNGHRYAHRVAYEMVYGPIPPELEIDHICRTRACVNIAHLRAVKHRQNMLAEGCLAPPKIHSLKTHCPRGHIYSRENIYLDYFQKTGRRVCRLCTHINSRATYQRKKAQHGI